MYVAIFYTHFFLDFPPFFKLLYQQLHSLGVGQHAPSVRRVGPTGPLAVLILHSRSEGLAAEDLGLRCAAAAAAAAATFGTVTCASCAVCQECFRRALDKSGSLLITFYYVRNERLSVNFVEQSNPAGSGRMNCVSLIADDSRGERIWT